MVHRTDDLGRNHVTNVSGIQVTTPARTLLDLAAPLHPKQHSKVTQEALASQIVTLSQLQQVLGDVARRGKPGVAVMRAFLDGGIDGVLARATALEQKGRAVLRLFGFTDPTPQYSPPWNKDRFFDDAYVEEGIAIEWDSRRWHSRVDDFDNDRRKDAEAVSHGWVVLRFTWKDVTEDPGSIGERLRSTLDLRKTG